jgi:hypothetical protein
MSSQKIVWRCRCMIGLDLRNLGFLLALMPKGQDQPG